MTRTSEMGVEQRPTKPYLTSTQDKSADAHVNVTCPTAGTEQKSQQNIKVDTTERWKGTLDSNTRMKHKIEKMAEALLSQREGQID